MQSLHSIPKEKIARPRMNEVLKSGLAGLQHFRPYSQGYRIRLRMDSGGYEVLFDSDQGHGIYIHISAETLRSWSIDNAVYLISGEVDWNTIEVVYESITRYTERT